ncbi:MAG: ATP-grasp domain-containing protein [Candidatus Dormiibacterota bacterium]
MSANPVRVVFLGPDPLPAVAGGLPVICADDCGVRASSNSEIEQFQLPGAVSSAALMELPAVQARLRSTASAVTFWKSSAAVERIASSLGLVVANAPALIARRIENKSHFNRDAAAAGLPLPPALVGVAGAALLQAAAELPSPFVFQLAHGFSGEHTYPAASLVELGELFRRFAGRACRVAQRVDGTPVTVTGVIAHGRLLIGQACVQLTGLPSLTPHPLGSCGNDYSRSAPEAEVIHKLALKAAEWLRRRGHLGIFGLDLVVGPDGRIWCIEVNPRMVASVPLFDLSARDRGEPGLLRLHLASFGLADALESALECHWSQLILYQRTERLAQPGVATASGRLSAAGQFIPEAELGLRGPAPGQVGLLVQEHSRPGRELARLWFEGPCCAPDGSLLAPLEAYVRELRSQLEIPLAVGTDS